MGVYGPVGMALITVAQAVALTIIAGDFADRPSQTLAAAEDALEDPALLIPRMSAYRRRSHWRSGS